MTSDRTWRCLAGVLSETCGLTLAFIFQYAAIQKAIEPESAIAFVRNLTDFGEPVAITVVFIASLIEGFLAALLIAGANARLVGIVVFLTLVVFTASIVYSSISDSWTGCGCFGSNGGESVNDALSRNGGLMALAACVAVFGTRTPCRDRGDR